MDESFDINPTELRADITKQMPQDQEAEVAVLSAMLLSSDVLQECLITLEPDDFYLPSHRIMFEAMRTMFDRSMAIDHISLADYLRSQGNLEKVGGLPQLLRLTEYTSGLQSWNYHVDMLKRDTVLRRMITACAQISAVAYNAPEDTKEVVDQAEKMILSVTNNAVKRSEISMSELVSLHYDEFMRLVDAKSGGIEGVATGISQLDGCLFGLRPGQMIVVGARPGVGKTSFALTIAANAAAAGSKVVFFSLEMSRMEIAQRLVAAESGVGLKAVRTGLAETKNADKQRQADAVLEATERLSAFDMVIDDTTGTTVTEIRAKARRILAKNTKPALIIIDYLQLLSPPQGRMRADSRATEVAEMSRGIKIMAKDLGVPVMALSQLNRTLENRTGKRPQLSDLRESGAIEQDADVVLLLDRSTTAEEAARQDRPDENVTTLIVAKNRSGNTCDIPLTFQGGSTRFIPVGTYEQQLAQM